MESKTTAVNLPHPNHRPVIPMPRQCRKYTTLLTLDGGGLKGIISTQILLAVSNHTKQYLLEHQHLLKAINSTFHYDRITDFHIDMADYFDAVAGISAGSWIATYIASKGGGARGSARVFNQAFIRQRYGYVRPGSLEGLEVFFMEYGARIYPLASPFPFSRPRFWPIPWTLPRLRVPYATVPAHPVAGLEWTLNQFLGDTKLSDVSTSLLVVAFDLNTRSAMQFVHDKVEPVMKNLRRLYLFRTLIALRDGTTRVKELSKKYPAKNCTVEAQMAFLQEKNATSEYLDVEDVFKGEGKWGHQVRVKIKPETLLGAINNFVVRRNPKDWIDYLNPGMGFAKDLDFYLRDVARASSAFPVLHQAKGIRPIGGNGTVHEMIDGAMVGNNPTMQSWIWLMRKKFVSVYDVATLSIGTGTVKQQLDGLARAGALQWLAPITPILLDDSSEFQQSTLNALFYWVLRAKEANTTNQCLRIQVRRESGTREGTLLSFADIPTSLNALRAMGRETALEYHWNIKDFVENYMFGGCSAQGRMEITDDEIKAEFYEEYRLAKETYEELLKNVTDTVCPKE